MIRVVIFGTKTIEYVYYRQKLYSRFARNCITILNVPLFSEHSNDMNAWVQKYTSSGIHVKRWIFALKSWVIRMQYVNIWIMYGNSCPLYYVKWNRRNRCGEMVMSFEGERRITLGLCFVLGGDCDVFFYYLFYSFFSNFHV